MSNQRSSPSSSSVTDRDFFSKKKREESIGSFMGVPYSGKKSDGRCVLALGQ